MCRPASFIVTKTKVLWSRKSDSHEEIISQYKTQHRLNDRSDPPNFVRVEIVPPNEHDFDKPLKDWLFHVDQDKVPDWFDKSEAEVAVRKELENWCAKKLIRDGESRDVKDGDCLVAICGGTVSVIRGGTVKKIFKGMIRYFCKFSIKIEGSMSVVVDATGSTAVCHVGTDKEREVSSGAGVVADGAKQEKRCQ